MPQFEIEQYELHTQKIRVDAPTAAQAINKVLNGEGTQLDNSLEYIQIDENLGMQADPHLAAELEGLGVSFGLSAVALDSDDVVVPSIRSIKEVPEGNEQDLGD